MPHAPPPDNIKSASQRHKNYRLFFYDSAQSVKHFRQNRIIACPLFDLVYDGGGEVSPPSAFALRAIRRSPLCGRSNAAPATPWLIPHPFPSHLPAAPSPYYTYTALAQIPPVPEPFANCTAAPLHLHCPRSSPTHSRAICLLHRRSIITLIHLFIFILNTVFVIDHGDLWITPKSPESKAIPKPSACGRIVDDLWIPVDNSKPQKLSTSLPTDFHNVIHGVVLIFVHS